MPTLLDDIKTAVVALGAILLAVAGAIFLCEVACRLICDVLSLLAGRV